MVAGHYPTPPMQATRPSAVFDFPDLLASGLIGVLACRHADRDFRRGGNRTTFMRVLLIIGYLLVAFGIALGLFAAGLAAAGHDLTLAAGKVWFAVDSSSLNTFQSIVQRYLHPGLWDNVVVPLLLRPAWEASLFLVVLTVSIGIALVVAMRASRRARRRLMPRGS
jgi:hypothetical protein